MANVLRRKCISISAYPPYCFCRLLGARHKSTSPELVEYPEVKPKFPKGKIILLTQSLTPSNSLLHTYIQYTDCTHTHWAGTTNDDMRGMRVHCCWHQHETIQWWYDERRGLAHFSAELSPHEWMNCLSLLQQFCRDSEASSFIWSIDSYVGRNWKSPSE